jgi:uncharacterized membrane protein YgaE (UPF0421/DUF939 family)
MKTSTETSAEEQLMASRTQTRPPRPSRGNYALFFISWFMLIAIGVMSTILYSNYLKEQIAADISKQTEAQLLAVKEDYQKQLADFKTSVSADMDEMQKKVDTFNELLAFTKDSANSKTDSSNQLYTQLDAVKKQLDELKKNLDVLK